MSTKDLVEAGSISGLKEGLSLRPGSPCDNFQGYCDVFLKCRKVDAEGPLVRLKNLLFNQETLLTIVQWVTEFWWAVLLMGIAFVIFMAVFIKCFAIHTPSSNPRYVFEWCIMMKTSTSQMYLFFSGCQRICISQKHSDVLCGRYNKG